VGPDVDAGRCGFALLVLVLGGLVGIGVATAADGQSRVAPLVSIADVRFIPAAAGSTVDDPFWIGKSKLLVTVWGQRFSHLAVVSTLSGNYASQPTLREPGCHPTSAQFPTWDAGAIVYLTGCFGNLSKSDDRGSGLAVLDLGTGRNRAFGTVRFSLAFNGRFSFRSDGRQAVIDSGGLYAQLQWLKPNRVVPIKQGLTIAYGASWSPDGKTIIFAGVPRNHGGGDVALADNNLYTFDPAHPRRLHLVVAGLHDFRASSPGWMPNSRWAVLAMQPPGQPYGLWIINVTNGKRALLLRRSDLGRARVAPNGRAVAVSEGSQDPKPPRTGIDLVPLPPASVLRSHLG
jgi:Tol biopolymer transport system component